ncbi:MAG TPA: membrane protein insertase YidC [Spirochaetota bacterium]|nr:membrane protein insertase YidC [Spirochaetota bacterium]
MEKRTLLAFVLTAGLWAAWMWYFAPDKKNIEQNTAPGTTAMSTESTGAADQKSPEKSLIVIPAAKNVKEESIGLTTEKFVFELTNRGGAIKKANYKERNIDLVFGDKFSSRGTLDFAVHFSEDEFMKGNSMADAAWNTAKVDGRTVKFFTDITIDGKPLRIEKIYRFTEKGYDFTIDYAFINTGKENLKFKNSSVVFSPSDILGPELDYSNRYNGMVGIFSIGSDYTQNMKGGGFFSKAEDLKKKDGAVDYTGIMSRYFLLIMKPKDFTGTSMLFDNRAHTGSRTGMTVEMKDIAPGAQVLRSFRVYLGEKDKTMLKTVDPLLVDASDVSTLIEPIRYFVIWALTWINKLFGNLGWALVVFSILTKIVFMPLTKKSTDSMKKMQELGPEIKKMQAKYKDKPDVAQREMMRMYKENKVSPLGGCLPLLLQMPFFFGLYSALINSIDMWHAPFMFWMKDLSMPDTVLTVSGFNINILPLLMTVSTIIQQKQTMVDTGNQQQKMMMYMMPVILLFIFWNMPSGLVLYWLLQNLYQILNQTVVNRIGKKA